MPATRSKSGPTTTTGLSGDRPDRGNGGPEVGHRFRVIALQRRAGEPFPPKMMHPTSQGVRPLLAHPSALYAMSCFPGSARITIPVAGGTRMPILRSYPLDFGDGRVIHRYPLDFGDVQFGLW